MRLLDREANPFSTRRLFVWVISILTIGAVTISVLAYAMSKQVTVADDDGFYESFVTYRRTVAEVLQDKGIILHDGDETNFALDGDFPDGAEIIVSRAVIVQIINGEEDYLRRTAKKTIADLLSSEGIQVSESTVLNVQLEDAVFEGMTVSIVHTSEEVISVEEIIPSKIVKKPTSTLKEGETKVVQEGNEGLLKKEYKVYYENNKEVSRELLSETIVTSAEDKIIEYGEAVKKTAVTYSSGTLASRGGELRYKAVITASASAYCINGRTATGMQTKVGVVAVDPSVIPLGSRLYIEAADGSWSYGSAVAADTGGSIKGNKVDLYMETKAEALKFGRRSAKVYILE